jgi:hypothetical protein
MSPRRARRALIVATLLALAASVSLLGACGGGDSGGVAAINDGTAARTTSSNAAAPADREAALLKAAQCMRDNGVKDFPDPQVDSNGDVRPGGFRAQLDPNDPTVRKAFTACRSLFAAARPQFTPEQQQKLQDALLAFAKCVRAHGYDLPDPTFGAPPGQGRGPFSGVNRNDPAFVKARQACQQVLAGAFPGGGRGFGGPGGVR